MTPDERGRSKSLKKIFVIAVTGTLLFGYLIANLISLFSGLPLLVFMIISYFIGIVWAMCTSVVVVTLLFFRNIIIK